VSNQDVAPARPPLLDTHCARRLRSTAIDLPGKTRSTSKPQGGRFSLPAEFLIASDGSMLASKYGSHAYDQWSIDELLALSPLDTQKETLNDENT
jgi:hypothetical protein